jgi:uncharacterized protein YdhG (YjbR/CyaY superfamily)
MQPRCLLSNQKTAVIMMAKTNFRNVDEYIAAQPAAAQVVLENVRSSIRTALPDAEEVISYKMPAYKMTGEVVLYFAGWKQHYSLYPASEYVVATLKNQLPPYKVNRGTIRFALSEPVPVSVIKRIATLRAKEVARRRDVKKSTFRSPRKDDSISNSLIGKERL